MARTKTTAEKKVVEPEVEGNRMVVPTMRVSGDALYELPKRSHPGDAGADLTCVRYTLVYPDCRSLLPTNIAVAIPAGYVGLLVPRSSALHAKGLLVNTGVIDSGYRGELQLVVCNLSKKAVHIEEGERIAQLLLVPVVTDVEFREVDDKHFPEGDRGSDGFGSTGGIRGA